MASVGTTPRSRDAGWSGSAADRTSPPADNAPFWIVTLGLVFIVLYAGALSYAMGHGSYDVWGAMLIAPFLVLATIPLAFRVARMEDDRKLASLIIAALFFKLLASLVRYAVGEEVYDGSADANQYYDHGVRLAESYRQGDFTADVEFAFIGTGFIRALTGIVFAVIGPTEIGGFLLFAWMGFWGLYFFYRAFRVGFPDGDHRRYAYLVFLLPSLLYWPSSIGKESWMLFTLGLGVLGAAKVLAYERGGWWLLALGVGGTSLARPHMSALLFCAFAAAYLARRPRRQDVLTPLIRIGGLILVLTIGLVVLRQAESFLGVDEAGGGTEGVDAVLSETEENTGQGGSEFQAERVRSPVQLPAATIAIMFRPFPHEADNAQMLLASLEGVVLVALFGCGWRRLAAAPRLLRSHPYLVFALVYAILFVIGFSSFGNFGILTRQRVQLFPVALVFLGVPLPALTPRPWHARN